MRLLSYLLPAVYLLLLAPSSLSAQDNVTFTYVDEDDFFFCVEDSTQSIQITPQPGRTLTRLRIIWILGSTPDVIVNDPTNLTHTFTYPARALLDRCNYTDAGCGGVCYTTQVFALYDDSPNEQNISRTVTFRKPPQLTIQAQSTYCVGQTATLRSTLCPNNDPTAEDLIWTLPDGSTILNQNSVDYTFPSAGTYRFEVENMNSCGSGGTSRTINVIEGPMAAAVADSNVVAAMDTDYRLCFDGEASIRLNSDASTGLTSRQWRVSPFARIEENNDTVTRAFFTRAGTYTFTLRGTNNNCNLTDEDQFTVEVIETDVLTLEEQTDECISIDYTPTPLNSNATYTVDGTVVPNADFPLTLGVGQHTVLAELPDNGICPTVPLTDTFTVSAVANAAILTPADTLCDQSGPISFVADPPTGGTWRLDGAPFGGTLNPASLAGGNYVVSYGNAPCLVEDQINLTILSTTVSVPGPTPLCIDQAAVDFSSRVTPAGGTFSGSGITPAGIFDPAAVGVGVYDLTYRFVNALDTTCAGSESFRVEVSELAAAFMTGDCDGNEVCFELPPGSGPFDRVTWDFDGLGTSNANEPCFEFPGEGSYAVRLTVERGPCTSTALQTVSIAPAPAPSFSLDFDPDNCSVLNVGIVNNSGGGGTLNYEWRLNGDVFSTAPDPGPLTLQSFAQDSLWTIDLTLANACESNAAPAQTVLTRPLPAARFGTDRSQYCSADTFVVANNSFGGVSGYTWTLDGRTIGTDSVPPLVSIVTDSARTVELCLLTENTCGRDTLCESIRIIPTNVRALFNVGVGVVCAGDTLRIRNFATAGVPVRYDLGDGRFTTVANPAVVYDQPGTYEIRQRAFGCGSEEFAQTIEVLPSPVADFNVAQGCPGIPVRFNNLGDNTLPAFWDFGDGSPVVETFSPEHTFPAPGDYEVCLTVEDPGPDNCNRTRCRTVNIVTPPVAGFATEGTFCVNTPVLFTTDDERNSISCRWTFGDGNVGTGCVTAHFYDTAGIYSVGQTIIDSRGCEDTITQTVFIRPAPDLSFSFDQRGCTPDSVAFANASVDAGSYTWNFGDGSFSNQTNPTHVYGAAGTYTVSLGGNGLATGCALVIDTVITVRETPVARIAAETQELCFGESWPTRSASTGPISDLRWDFGDGTVAFDATPAPHLFPAPGQYEVRLRVSNDGVCADSTTISVTVHPPVEARTRVQGEIVCNGEETGALSVGVNGGTAPFEYAWSNGANRPDLDGLAAGVYTVTVTDANTCRLIVSDTVVEPAAVTQAAMVRRVSCFGGADGRIELAAAGGVPPYRIDWPGGSTTGVIEDLAAGEYPVTITDANDCTVETSVPVPENPELIIADSLQTISCFGEDDGAYVLRNLRGGIPPYTVRLAGDDYLREGNTLSRFDGLRPGVYSFTLTDSLGCAADLEFELIEPDEVVLELLDDTVTLSLGESIVLDSRFNARDSLWAWTPPTDLDCTDCAAPTARPLEPLTTYVATLTDGRGCLATDSVTIIVSIDREVYIPNTFTPNQDGRNDLFRVRSAFVPGIETIESFQIFDRWGNRMYEQRNFPPNDPAHGWDGRHNGRVVQLGTYVYQVVIRYVDGETRVESGEVRVLR